jgi:hypothetical protein
VIAKRAASLYYSGKWTKDCKSEWQTPQRSILNARRIYHASWRVVYASSVRHPPVPDAS